MRILIISDIHANLTALETVLEAAGQVDAVWCLGDLVGYGPDPNECIDLVRSLPNLTCLMGNHDAAVLKRIELSSFNNDARQSLNWTMNTLTANNLIYLESLPDTSTPLDCFLAHGSPRNPIWEYILNPYLALINFNVFIEKLAFVGHTHIPTGYFLRNQTVSTQPVIAGDSIKIEDRLIFNPGSVGQPRDSDARAAFAIYYPEVNRVQGMRVSYDIEDVQARILKAGLPIHNARRLADGR